MPLATSFVQYFMLLSLLLSLNGNHPSSPLQALFVEDLEVPSRSLQNVMCTASIGFLESGSSLSIAQISLLYNKISLTKLSKSCNVTFTLDLKKYPISFLCHCDTNLQGFKKSSKFIKFLSCLLVLSDSRRLVSPVGKAPVCCAGGLRFDSQPDHHSGS